MLQGPEFFKPLHVYHLPDRCPEIVNYVGLAHGWCVLFNGKYEAVWYDQALLNVWV